MRGYVAVSAGKNGLFFKGKGKSEITRVYYKAK